MITLAFALHDKTNLPSTPTTHTDKEPTFKVNFWSINENGEDVYERVMTWFTTRGVSLG